MGRPPSLKHRHSRKRPPDAARRALRCRNWRTATTAAYPPCAARPAPPDLDFVSARTKQRRGLLWAKLPGTTYRFMPGRREGHKMNCILLIGAGFSRNWGGWLADEVFDYLIGVRELDDTCRQLLNIHRTAGFEKALSVLQADKSPSARNPGSPLRLMEAAIEQMFMDMGRSWFRNGWDLEFMSPPETGRSNVKEFLARFDAIFSLNQDFLLEIGYCQRAEPMQAFNRRWHGLEFPGMVTRVSNPMTPASRWVGSRCPASRDVRSVAPIDSHTQPTYKLHGSSNWVDETGEQLQIVGGDKTANIASSRVLSLYKQEFERRLRLPDTRLMIIGYGFHDDHINPPSTRQFRGAVSAPSSSIRLEPMRRTLTGIGPTGSNRLSRNIPCNEP
jgi:hypothetical protein